MPKNGAEWIVAMRHGERADHAIDAVAEANPGLTSSGVDVLPTYADELVANLQDAGVELRNVDVEFIISPFKRCMETAAGVIKRFLAKVQPRSYQIYADLALGEVYGPIRIKGNSAKGVDVVEALRVGDHDAFQHQFAPHFPAPIIIRSAIAVADLPQWGETLPKARIRFKKAIMGNKGKLCIYITHGDALSDVMHKFHPDRTLYSVDFGGFLVFQGSADNDHFEMRAGTRVGILESEQESRRLARRQLQKATYSVDFGGFLVFQGSADNDHFEMRAGTRVGILKSEQESRRLDGRQLQEATSTNLRKNQPLEKELLTLISLANSQLSRKHVYGLTSLSVLAKTADSKANRLMGLSKAYLMHPYESPEAHLALMKLIVEISRPRDATSFTWFKWHAPFGATRSAKVFLEGLQHNMQLKAQVMLAARDAGYAGSLNTQEDFATIARQMLTRLRMVGHTVEVLPEMTNAAITTP